MGIESINAAGSSYQGSGYSSEPVQVTEVTESKQAVNSRQTVNFQTDEAEGGENSKGLGITEASESSIKRRLTISINLRPGRKLSSDIMKAQIVSLSRS